MPRPATSSVTGNVPATPEFLEPIQEAVQRGIMVVNVTQCFQGEVLDETEDPTTSLLGGATRIQASTELTIEQALWKFASERQDAELLEAYLEKYPNGEFAEEARERLAALKVSQVSGLPDSSPRRNQQGFDRSRRLPPRCHGRPALTVGRYRHCLRRSCHQRRQG